MIQQPSPFITACIREMLKQVRTKLPFFAVESKKLTRWERIKYTASQYIARVRDAWLVLTGKATIGEDG